VLSSGNARAFTGETGLILEEGTVAVGDRTWQRQALINNLDGRHHAELLIGSVSSNERLERTIVDFYVNETSSSSAVLGTWWAQGILATIQWTAFTELPIPAPEDVGTADLSQADILWSRLIRIGEQDVFLDNNSGPAYAASVVLDAKVTRRPREGETGAVWFAWGLADFGGAGVETGFDKVFSRVLTTQVS
jgi:hypothetical protein